MESIVTSTKLDDQEFDRPESSELHGDNAPLVQPEAAHQEMDSPEETAITKMTQKQIEDRKKVLRELAVRNNHRKRNKVLPSQVGKQTFGLLDAANRHHRFSIGHNDDH